LGQTKDYEIGICCFSAKHPALRRKNKDWLVGNQDNVSECGDMSIRGLLFQWASTIKIQLSMLYKANLIIVSMKINLISPWYSWKIAELALKQQSLTQIKTNYWFCHWSKEDQVLVKKLLSMSLYSYSRKTQPIRTLYKVNTLFWLDNFGVQVHFDLIGGVMVKLANYWIVNWQLLLKYCSIFWKRTHRAK